MWSNIGHLGLKGLVCIIYSDMVRYPWNWTITAPYESVQFIQEYDKDWLNKVIGQFWIMLRI